MKKYYFLLLLAVILAFSYYPEKSALPAESENNPEIVWGSFRGNAERTGSLNNYSPAFVNFTIAPGYMASSPPEGCRIGCFIDTNDSLLSSPVFADLDGDGMDEGIAYHKDMIPPAFDRFGDFVFAFKRNKKGWSEDFPLERMWVFPLQDEVHTSFAIGERAIFFGSDDGNLYSLDYKGNLLWKYQTQGKVRSSPALTKERVFFGSDDGNLYALDYNGKLVWNYKTQGNVRSSPLAMEENDVVAVGSEDRRIYVFDVNGKLLNNYKTDGSVFSSPVVFYRNASIFFVVGSLDGNLYFFNETNYFPVKIGVPIYSTPAYLSVGNNPRVLLPSYSGGLLLVNETGFEALYVFNGSKLSSPAVGDMDRDYIVEISISFIHEELLEYNTIAVAGYAANSVPVYP